MPLPSSNHPHSRSDKIPTVLPSSKQPCRHGDEISMGLPSSMQQYSNGDHIAMSPSSSKQTWDGHEIAMALSSSKESWSDGHEIGTALPSRKQPCSRGDEIAMDPSSSKQLYGNGNKLAMALPSSKQPHINVDKVPMVLPSSKQPCSNGDETAMVLPSSREPYSDGNDVAMAPPSSKQNCNNGNKIAMAFPSTRQSCCNGDEVALDLPSSKQPCDEIARGLLSSKQPYDNGNGEAMAPPSSRQLCTHGNKTGMALPSIKQPCSNDDVIAMDLRSSKKPCSNGGLVDGQLVHEISISIDLVSTAKQLLSFLNTVSGLPHLHGGSSVMEAIRRYKSCWMPLVATHDLHSGTSLVPPLDVRWVWLCHCLDPMAYQLFCKTHYGRVIDVPLFLDPSSERMAMERCRKVWNEFYPNEPFEKDFPYKNGQGICRSPSFQSPKPSHVEDLDLMGSIEQQIAFYNQVLQQYMCHTGFLHVARERYSCFLQMMHELNGKRACTPTYDIQLMWKCHQTSPGAYARDTEVFRGILELNDSIVRQQLQNGIMENFEQTSRMWEKLFGCPYERAGAAWPQVNMVTMDTSLDWLSGNVPATINWHSQNFDRNAKHDFLHPRYVLEVCVHVKSMMSDGDWQPIRGPLFLHTQTIKACKSLRQHISAESYLYDARWHKLCSMQCEVSTEGLVIGLRCRTAQCLGVPCFRKLLGLATVTWKELGNQPLLASEKPLMMKKNSLASDMGWVISASITPPIQGPYLLKGLLDRVTDDGGAMLSRQMRRLNNDKPQEGRWMSCCVLNHAGKECFIIRIRVAAGAWKSKIERPVGVDWNERIIHVHGGGWNYVSGSIGVAPDKILATATPLNDELEQYKMKWSFSTGETLTIQMPIENLEWERHLRFSLKGNHLGVVRLLNGRHMQYEVPSSVPEEEEGFVTVVRYTADARQGKATALFNWKISAMEVLPEEDIVLVMLICTATRRSVVDLGGKTLRSFYRRKYTRKRGPQRNWGAVVMAGGQEVPSELMFWYVNPEEVLDINFADMDNEDVLPKGASEQMYRGTSWLYAGSTKGLYKMSSRGSCESFGYDVGGDHHHIFGPMSGLPRLGSQTKVPEKQTKAPR